MVPFRARVTDNSPFSGIPAFSMVQRQASINNWWGTLIGAGLGWMIAGVWGAPVGLLVGHAFDRREAALARFRRQGSAPERFPDTVFQVMGYLAKSDGRVSEAQIAVATQAISHLGLDEETAERVRQCFNEGKQRDFPLDSALRRARRICGRRTDRARIFLELLVQVALADGPIRATEQRILEKACYRLGMKRRDLNQIIAMVSMQQNRSDDRGRPRRPSPVRDVGTAYSVLGVTRRCSDETVKKAYRRLMSQHHPDKLAASGVSPELLKLAQDKTVEIRAAYDRIRESRGMR